MTELDLDAPPAGPIHHGPPPNVAVVIGTGLIGASVGCALSEAGCRVHLRDHKLSHARVAAATLRSGWKSLPTMSAITSAEPPITAKLSSSATEPS